MRTLLLLVALCLATFNATAQWRIRITVDNTSNLAGRQLGIRLFDRTTGIEAVSFREPAIPEGATYFRDVLGLVQGHDYNVDLYIDVNGSGKYEPPPADLAWRQTFNGVTGDSATTFDVSAATTDIEFPNPNTSVLHHVAKTYVGVWKNLTFNTNGNATATSSIDYKQGPSTLSMTVSNGAFGQPTPVVFNFTGAMGASGDSALFTPEVPAEGYLSFVRGRVLGLISLTAPPVVLAIDGYHGDKQIMFTYNMSGSFSANGVLTLTEATATDVSLEPESRLMLSPNPTVAQTVNVSSDVAFDRIEVHSIAGELLISVACEATMHHRLGLNNLANGAYLLTTSGGATSTHAMLVVR